VFWTCVGLALVLLVTLVVAGELPITIGVLGSLLILLAPHRRRRKRWR
jgi:hypothetical protein